MTETSYRLPLSQGKFALIDERDVSKVLSMGKWSVANVHGTWRIYTKKKDGTRKNISLPRFLMDAPKGMIVDHINHDTLDNRRSNLRICTRSQNMMNMKVPTSNAIGLKGVFFNKQRKKYQANICLDKKYRYLGLFENPLEAARAYNVAAEKFFGEFAYLNQV